MLNENNRNMNIQYATLSKTGKRSNNEDAFNVIQSDDNSRWLGIICDGLGGHAFGEVASETVIKAFTDYWMENDKEKDTEDKVNNACLFAYNELNKCADSLKHAEMGTTMVMASIEGNIVTVVHIGDSRCYILRKDGGLLYQTEDHVNQFLGWETLSRCLFSYNASNHVPDMVQLHLEAGDRILLCSDGLYKSIYPYILQERMMDNKSPEDILDTFNFLCEKNGDDNYTAILAYIE